MNYIGIDIGGTNIKIGVLDDSDSIVHRNSFSTNADSGYETMIGRIKEIIRNVLKIYPAAKSIGIGVPGVVNYDGIVTISPNLTGWLNVPLQKIISQEFGLPVALDNDANVAGFAELKLGAGFGEKYFIYVTLGTGVGCTIIADGKPFRGNGGGAGEIGHLIIDAHSKDKFESKSFRIGVMEEFCGRSQIIQRAKLLLKNYPKSELNDIHDFDVSQISEAAYKFDAAAIECLKETGYYLGLGLASAMNLLDIPLVILGGGISESHPVLLDSTLDTIRRRALPGIAKNAELRKARYLKDSGLIG
ncbi:MAG: glucokinase, partial [Bacteroidota bacterium]|nr:glucokinase [Bacteroidota bacterium]